MRPVSLAFALVVTVATSTACGPKRVTIGGVEMTPEQAAATLYEQAEAARAEGDLETAKARYREIVNRFEEAERAPDALAALGELQFEAKGCEGARLYLERLVAEYPGHTFAPKAEDLLDECPVAAEPSPGDARDGSKGAYATFESRFEDAPSDAAKRQIASEAADAALAAGDGAVAVRWLLRVRELEPEPAQRTAQEAEIREVIERELSFVDIRRLVESLPGDGFPKPFLSYKLGRIQYHVRDYAGAQETLQAYVQSSPGGEHVPGARRLLERIAAMSTVAPTKIGVLLPLSGKHRSYGELALRTIRLALGVDEKGRGPGVQIVVRDTESDAVKAETAAESLVLEDHVVAILGPIFSYAAVPAARTAQALGTPILTISTADELPALGAYVFRNALTNKEQVEALVEYAMGIREMESFAILYPRHPYGEEMLHLFWDAVVARKGEIKGVESYAMTDTTFTEQVKRLVARDILDLRADFRKAERECEKQPDSYRVARCKEEIRKNLKPIVDFDGLFIPDYPGNIPMVTAALAFEDIIVETDPRRLRVIEKTLGRDVKPVTLLGGSGWNSSRVPERSGRNVENAVFTDGFFAEADEKVVAEFVNAYEKAHDRTPRLYPEALIWDSARLLGHVLKTEAPQTREALRASLVAVRDFPGVAGAITFGGANDAQRPVRILTIERGKIREVPDPDAPPEGEAAGAPAATPSN